MSLPVGRVLACAAACNATVLSGWHCNNAVGLPSLSRVATLEHRISCLLNCPSVASDCAYLALPALPALLFSPSTSAVCYQVANLIERVPIAKQEAVKKYMHGTASCANLFERVSVSSCVHMPVVCACVSRDGWEPLPSWWAMWQSAQVTFV